MTGFELDVVQAALALVARGRDAGLLVHVGVHRMPLSAFDAVDGRELVLSDTVAKFVRGGDVTVFPTRDDPGELLARVDRARSAPVPEVA